MDVPTAKAIRKKCEALPDSIRQPLQELMIGLSMDGNLDTTPVNILLLGDAGVGKSKTIDGISEAFRSFDSLAHEETTILRSSEIKHARDLAKKMSGKKIVVIEEARNFIRREDNAAICDALMARMESQSFAITIVVGYMDEPEHLSAWNDGILRRLTPTLTIAAPTAIEVASAVLRFFANPNNYSEGADILPVDIGPQQLAKLRSFQAIFSTYNYGLAKKLFPLLLGRAVTTKSRSINVKLMNEVLMSL